MSRNKWKVKDRLRGVLVAVVVTGLVFSVITFVSVKFLIEPNLSDVAEMRAEALVSRTVNKALAEQFRESDNRYDLFTVIKDETGAMEMVQADSLRINLLMSDLSVKLQECFNKMEAERYKVSIGTLFGSKFLSQVGPSVELTIIPLSVTSMDFRTEFESQGINQTKYKIYIEMDCRIRVLAPFSSEMFNTKGTILVAEAVILGDVPDSYVEVPEEDILDVIDE